MNRRYETKVANNSLYTEAEADANRFNLKCLSVLCFIVVICEILNEVGIFKVPIIVMRLITILTLIAFSLPIIVYFIYDHLLHNENSILNIPTFKHLIIVSTYIGIGMLSISLSFHVVILLAVPPLIAAQYKNEKNCLTG